MKAFTPGKEIRRAVTIRSSDRAIPSREWILGLSAEGVTMREAWTRGGRRYRLSWRNIIGLALVHGMEDARRARPRARAPKESIHAERDE